ncbi:hypothetical protein [Kitasatospora griseola]
MTGVGLGLYDGATAVLWIAPAFVLGCAPTAPTC